MRPPLDRSSSALSCLRFPPSADPRHRPFALRMCVSIAALLVLPSIAHSIFDTTAESNTNLIEMTVTNFGSYGYDIDQGRAGLIYPNGTDRTAVFAAGLWMGARVGGDLRVSVAEYSMTYGPGPITAPGEWADPMDPRYRTYKVEPGDTPDSNPDYANWPAGDGAPVDSYGFPWILGDQMLWSVWNDLNPALRTTPAASALPLGIEVRHKTFAAYLYGTLERTVFLEWKILNRGSEPLTDAYVAAWVDPDLGGAGDDLVGCDTLRSLGYCYNSTDDDEVYGSTPPAVGIQLIQGPIVPAPGETAYVSGRLVPDYRNLPMTAFSKFISGTDPYSPDQSYNCMKGLERDGSIVFDPTTGLPTRFMVPGDPVTGTGWIDSNPADRRILVSSGPFTMAPGDTQTVAVAVVIGHGPDHLASVTALELAADDVPGLFRQFVETQPPLPSLLWSWDPEPRWLTGIPAGMSTFFGGIGFGREFFGSTLDDSAYVPVRIRFDSSESTTCARYDRNQGYLYVGTGTFRGSAYDISSPGEPRRLNICFSEYSNLDGIWEPDSSDLGGREYLFIMNSDYDGGVEYDDLNRGLSADVQYACWLRVRSPYAFFQTDPAVLTLYFPIPLAVGDGDVASRRIALADFRAYPNPVRDRVTVDFALSRPAPVTLSILDVSGRIVERSLPSAVYGAGPHRIDWRRSADRQRLASGVYFLRLQAGREIVSRRVVVIR